MGRVVRACPKCLFRVFRDMVRVPARGCIVNAAIIAFPQHAFRLKHYRRLYPEHRCEICGERRSILVVVDLGEVRPIDRPWEVVRIRG